MNIPAAESVYTTKYTGFKGVDFTSQICSPYRFPKAKNFIITDMVEKRPGYKALKTFTDGKINGMFCTIIDGITYYLIHTGSNLYSLTSFDAEPILLLSDLNNAKSMGFYANGYYYILTGKDIIRTNGVEAGVINEKTYNKPYQITNWTSTYSKTTYSETEENFSINDDLLTCKMNNIGEIPIRWKGGGEGAARYGAFFEVADDWSWELVVEECGLEQLSTERNLLSGWGAIEFPNFNNSYNNKNRNYNCGYPLPEDAAKFAYCVLMYEDGSCEYGEASRMKLTLDGNYLNYLEIFPTTLNNKHLEEPFKIYYELDSDICKNYEIYKSTATTYIQYGNGVYFFFTGNSTEPNMDWQSELNDPTYIPADNYTVYGTEDEILGYGQYGEYVAVFKKGSNDNNIYIKTAQNIDGLGVVFPVSIGVGGAVGGISPHTIRNLNGETLYLTKEGVYALTSLSLTNMKVTRNRSYFVDGQLLKEENLENAIATIWKNKYVLCVNNHCYILDAGQPLQYRDGSNNDYTYECLYWDNIPATTFMSVDNDLYFGTEDGRVCIFTDGEYSDDGADIDTVVATLLDDDGNYMAWKKMKKKGTGLLVKPYLKSSFDISFLYDNYENTLVKTAYADIFNFDDIDFDRFTFETSANPRIIPFLKKSKKYKAMQILIRSNNKEPLGFISIIKRYTFNNYVKRS